MSREISFISMEGTKRKDAEEIVKHINKTLCEVMTVYFFDEKILYKNKDEVNISNGLQIIVMANSNNGSFDYSPLNEFFAP